eukprot:1811605-Pyramimonas_sp.AAC.1
MANTVEKANGLASCEHPEGESRVFRDDSVQRPYRRPASIALYASLIASNTKRARLVTVFQWQTSVTKR